MDDITLPGHTGTFTQSRAALVLSYCEDPDPLTKKDILIISMFMVTLLIFVIWSGAPASL